MKLPCETGVWTILPSIRACLVQELLELGISQKEVALRMGITPAAVCQYTSGKRGGKTMLGTAAIQAIQDLARDMAANRQDDLGHRMCGICTLVKNEVARCGSSCIGEERPLPHAE